MSRLILHVDMDAFYAAVEQRDDPSLRGKPVIVGGGVRGVVTTASYEARPFGVRSAMPMAQAMRLCPHAVVIKPRMRVYGDESRLIRAILDRFTPDIEAVSIDEAYLDCTGTAHLHEPALVDAPALLPDLAESLRWKAGETMARAIKDAIRTERNLIASVGVASNKLLAKVASDLDKPDGLRVIRDQEAVSVLAPLPAAVLRGVGTVAAEKLKRAGISTCADLRNAAPELLQRLLGSQAETLRLQAMGRDARALERGRRAKSIGQSRTFNQDIARVDELRAILLSQVEHITQEARSEGLVAKRVTVTFRRPDFETFTRSTTLDEPTSSTAAIWAVALAQLETWWKASPGPLRLIGVTLGDLEPPGQLGLFAAPVSERATRVDAALDAIKAKFGNSAIRRASSKRLERGDGWDI